MGFRGRATFILELIPVDAYVDEAQDASDQHGTSGSNVSNVAPWSTFSSSNMIVMVKCPPLVGYSIGEAWDAVYFGNERAMHECIGSVIEDLTTQQSNPPDA